MKLKLPKMVLFLKTLKSVPIIIILSIIVLLAGTYGVWHYQTYYSDRQHGTLVSQGVNANVAVSDHTCVPNCNSNTNFVSLPMNLDGTEQPDYDSKIGSGSTILKNMTSYFEMFRLQTRLSYYFTSANNDRSVPARLRISLPPKIIYQPDKLAIRGDKYHFVSSKTCFARDGSDECATNLSVETVTDNDSSSSYDDYYTISWTGIEPFNKKVGYNYNKLKYALGVGSAEAYNPPPATNLLMLFRLPKEIRITFVSSQASVANVRALYGYLEYDTNSNVNNTFLAENSSCSGSSGDVDPYICYKTKIDLLVGTETVVPTLYTLQSMNFTYVPGGISVQGNVGGRNAVSNFSAATSNAVIYGGSVTDVVGGEQVAYPLDWSPLAGQIASLISQGIDSATRAQPLVGSSWFLNAPNTNPAEGSSATTFSTPPEGKLWLISGNQAFTNMNFDGTGTIIVDGNLTFNGDVTCSTGSRVGIISTGSITFNSNNIGCGSYLSIGELSGGGNISFTSKDAGRATGIFVAANNIVLPKMNDGQLFRINYDGNFANNPTILFSNILKLLDLSSNS